MSSARRQDWTLIPGDPPEVVVIDEEEACPYLEAETARRPLRLPLFPLDAAQFAERLRRGDRRYGRFLYTQHCPTCRACEPVRIDVQRFEMSASQRRAKARGDRLLRVKMGQPDVDPERLALFHAHGALRGLRPPGEYIGSEGYSRFLTDTCADTVELSFYLDGRLVAVAITDVAADGLSAVYTYYNPALKNLSLGVYAILHQIDVCRAQSKPWLYLGLYVADNAHMNYKRRYLPQERRIDGTWQRFERGA